jgi:hypothetical protein
MIERSSDKANKDYLKVSNDSLEIAMYNLKGNAFKLWIYFADNKQGYLMDLYPIDFCTKAKVSDSTYRRAFEELEKKGYLIKSKTQDNLYLFREVSLSDKIEKPDEVNSIDTDNFADIKRKYFDC